MANKEKSFKDFFSSLTLAAIQFSGAEPFEQFWKRAISETCLLILVKIGPAV